MMIISIFITLSFLSTIINLQLLIIVFIFV